MSEMTLFDAEPTASAVLSECGTYRYHLTRVWDESRGLLPFLMCNPSDADAFKVDPTVTRCMGFATRLGFGGFEALNAYGFRSPKPPVMWAAQKSGVDIVGPENDGWLTDLLLRAHRQGIPVVAAWGAHPKPERVAQVLALPHADALWSFGVTNDGQPRHPLMLRSDTPLTRWPQGRAA